MCGLTLSLCPSCRSDGIIRRICNIPQKYYTWGLLQVFHLCYWQLHQMGKDKESQEWQVLRMVRGELEIKNFNLKYLFGFSLSANVRNANSWSTVVLFCGGEL